MDPYEKFKFAVSPDPFHFIITPMRRNLVFVSTNHGKMTPNLFGANRTYDVAVHDYGKSGEIFERVGSEYWWAGEAREKLESAALLLAALPHVKDYEQFCFLDDDLTCGTNELNYWFGMGKDLHLSHYQPALSLTSFSSHSHLYQKHPAPYLPRRVPFCEVMCPFFSKEALEKCLWSFDLNISGWGLDCYVWPKLVGDCWVIDQIPIGHYREPNRERRWRVQRNGLSPFQELDIVGKIKYDGESQW